jgi:hypothetical protein
VILYIHVRGRSVARRESGVYAVARHNGIDGAAAVELGHRTEAWTMGNVQQSRISMTAK